MLYMIIYEGSGGKGLGPSLWQASWATQALQSVIASPVSQLNGTHFESEFSSKPGLHSRHCPHASQGFREWQGPIPILFSLRGIQHRLENHNKNRDANECTKQKTGCGSKQMDGVRWQFFPACLYRFCTCDLALLRRKGSRIDCPSGQLLNHTYRTPPPIHPTNLNRGSPTAVLMLSSERP